MFPIAAKTVYLVAAAERPITLKISALNAASDIPRNSFCVSVPTTNTPGTCGVSASAMPVVATNAPVARYTTRWSPWSAHQPASKQPAPAIAALPKPVTSTIVPAVTPHSRATPDQKLSTPLSPIGEMASAATTRPSRDLSNCHSSRAICFTRSSALGDRCRSGSRKKRRPAIQPIQTRPSTRPGAAGLACTASQRPMPPPTPFPTFPPSWYQPAACPFKSSGTASAISPPREGASKLDPSSAVNNAAAKNGTVVRVKGIKACSSSIPLVVAAPMTYHFLSVSPMSAIGAQKSLPAFGASPIATIEAATSTGKPALVTRYGTTTVMYPLVIPNGRLSRRKVEGCGESPCEDTSLADARICDLR